MAPCKTSKRASGRESKMSRFRLKETVCSFRAKKMPTVSQQGPKKLPMPSETLSLVTEKLVLVLLVPLVLLVTLVPTVSMVPPWARTRTEGTGRNGRGSVYTDKCLNLDDSEVQNVVWHPLAIFQHLLNISEKFLIQNEEICCWCLVLGRNGTGTGPEQSS